MLMLKELRSKAGLSQAQLSQRAGIPRRTIEDIERRGDCRISTARAICDALGVGLDVFYTKETKDSEEGEKMDLIETSLENVNYFRFKLPVSAVGISGDDIIQICVEYGDSIRSPEMIAAVVWAGFVGKPIRGYILYTEIPKCDEPTESIFNALNESQEFQSTLKDFIHHFG